jgi:zinc D-Ala-D-Ala dipeptidase
MQPETIPFKDIKATYQKAAILSFLLPGAGQIYQKRLFRGLIFFALFAASFLWAKPQAIAVLIAFAAALECFSGPRTADPGYTQRYFVFLAASLLGFIIWFFAVGGEWILGRGAAAAEAPAATNANADLVDLKKVDFTIQVEMVFAGTENVAAKKLLPENRCVLRRSVANALARVQESLKLQGLGLKVLDCYRPLQLETKFLEWMPAPVRKAFRADNNPFYRGAAVDVFLIQQDGQPLTLPGPYEWAAKTKDPRGRAFTAATQRRAKSNLKTLTQAMVREGFVNDEKTWWRFRINTWEQYPPSDTPFSDIP